MGLYLRAAPWPLSLTAYPRTFDINPNYSDADNATSQSAGACRERGGTFRTAELRLRIRVFRVRYIGVFGQRGPWAAIVRHDIPPPRPTVDSFAATPSSLPALGGNVTLAWHYVQCRPRRYSLSNRRGNLITTSTSMPMARTDAAPNEAHALSAASRAQLPIQVYIWTISFWPWRYPQRLARLSRLLHKRFRRADRRCSRGLPRMRSRRKSIEGIGAIDADELALGTEIVTPTVTTTYTLTVLGTDGNTIVRTRRG